MHCLNGIVCSKSVSLLSSLPTGSTSREATTIVELYHSVIIHQMEPLFSFTTAGVANALPLDVCLLYTVSLHVGNVMDFPNDESSTFGDM